MRRSQSSSTWLIGGRGDATNVESRAAGLRQQISIASADFEREKLQERLARLVGATVALRVGGASVVEQDGAQVPNRNGTPSSRGQSRAAFFREEAFPLGGEWRDCATKQ